MARKAELIYKLECLLCHATGGMLSKHTYDLKTMETVVADYINKSYDEGYRDAEAEVARKIFEEIEDVLNNIGYFDELDFEALKNKYAEGRNERYASKEEAEKALAERSGK